MAEKARCLYFHKQMLLFLKSLPYYQPQNLRPKKKKKNNSKKEALFPKGWELILQILQACCEGS